MNVNQLVQLFSELLGEARSITAGDFWSLQGLVSAAIVGLSISYARWSRVRRLAGRNAPSDVAATTSLFQRLAPSGLLCILALSAYAAFRVRSQPGALLLIQLALGTLMLGTRLVVFLLTRSLVAEKRLSVVERAAGWAIWFLSAVLMLQWLAPDSLTAGVMAIPVAGSRVSLLDAIRAVVILLLLIVAATYLGAFVERRLLSVAGLPIGMKVGFAKVTRVLLVVVAMLLALDFAGMDLSALTVLGGALGVGLGFGLQRIASNVVSGFVLLGDRSIRPGDVITIGTRFGVVRELRARYVVVRDRDGVDTLIPNENIITSEVINWSYGDRRIRLKLPVMISYQDNPREAMKLMEAAAVAHPRVEDDPAPASRVMGFADSGISLELRFWIRDPEDGVNNVRSDLFLAIWDSFKAAGITLPYPQRDIHFQDGKQNTDRITDQA